MSGSGTLAGRLSHSKIPRYPELLTRSRARLSVCVTSDLLEAMSFDITERPINVWFVTGVAKRRSKALKPRQRNLALSTIEGLLVSELLCAYTPDTT